MSSHDMIPSTVEGFHSQCRNCGALDTELRFNVSQICPNAPQELAAAFYSENAIDKGSSPAFLFDPTPNQLAAIHQAAWFQGYVSRQLEASMDEPD